MSEPTYTISEGAITCHRCGMISHHPGDVANLHCGYCKRFHQPQPTYRPDALLNAAIDVLNQLALLTRDDPAYLWRIGGYPLLDAYQALKHVVAAEARRAAESHDAEPPF